MNEALEGMPNRAPEPVVPLHAMRARELVYAAVEAGWCTESVGEAVWEHFRLGNGISLESFPWQPPGER